MHRLSSNYTLFLKIIFPTLWIVFFGSFLVAMFIVDPYDAPMLTTTKFRSIYIISYGIFLTLLYFTVMPLKRLDSDGTYFFVSNYFKTYRYKIEDIESIKEANYLLFKTLRFKLRSKGSFGMHFTILVDEFRMNEFIKDFPDKLAGLFKSSGI